jgi:glutaminyl-tRNA synthetase
LNHPAPETDKAIADWKECINPASLVVNAEARIEAALATAPIGVQYQFEREGFFCRDACSDKLVFNRIVTLKDSWAG